MVNLRGPEEHLSSGKRIPFTRKTSGRVGCCDGCATYTELAAPWATPTAVRMGVVGAELCATCSALSPTLAYSAILGCWLVNRARQYHGLADWVREQLKTQTPEELIRQCELEALGFYEAWSAGLSA